MFILDLPTVGSCMLEWRYRRFNMKVFASGVLLSVCGLWSTLVWAHGDDKPGPHGGFIKMPGAFHTELKPQGKSKLQVYLLDIDWKNPSVKDSDLKVTHETGQQSVEARCRVEKLSYICHFPEKIDLTQKGRLQVEATREKQKGNEVTYDLPLSLPQAAPSHQHH